MNIPQHQNRNQDQEKTIHKNALAEKVANKFHAEPKYMNQNGSSWYIHIKHWLPPPSAEEFNVEWELHPHERRKVNLYGKVYDERRCSQAWGVSMTYSGLDQIARPAEESTMVPLLLDRINSLMKDVHECEESEYSEYNACLQNWYEPDDIIGLHADDESYLLPGLPIFSLSWGGTRRFLFRSKVRQKDENSKSQNDMNEPIGKKIELWLESGDLLIMGGTCQETHKHEVPKVRSTMDPATSNRINWTIRGIKKE